MKLLLLERPKNVGIIKDREVEYFGPWAQPINSPEDLSRPAFDPYPNPESVYNASSRAMNTASEILESLIKILPGLTGVNKGRKFWRIFLGHYLISLAGIVEDIKSRHLSLPEKNYTLGLPGNDCREDYIPYSWSDTQEYILYDSNFRWNAMATYLKKHYKHSEFVEYLRVPPENITKRPEELYVKILQGDFKRLFRKTVFILLKNLKLRSEMKWLDDAASNSLIWDCYQLEDINFRRMNVAVLPERYLPDINSFPSFQADNERRQKLSNSLPSPYGELLSSSFPLIALEGLSYLVGLTEEKLGKFSRIKRIYTHGQGFADEAVKRAFLALLTEEGREVVSIQHGGGMTYLANSSMFMETTVLDRYIPWGPGYCDSAKRLNTDKVKALPSIYLSKLKRKSSLENEKKKWNVLFVIAEDDHCIKWLYTPLFPDMAYDYFRRQKVLFDYFGARKSTAVKVYRVSYGWGQSAWVKSRYPRIKLLRAGRFTDYSLQSKLIIIDYNSTGFLETLAMKKPFLATWNRRWFKGERLFEQFIDKLAEVGVFHEQPETLIAAYDQAISQDVQLWWNESRRQAVLKEMADNFAMASDTAEEDWAGEFQGKRVVST